jgi:hypothetical protein
MGAREKSICAADVVVLHYCAQMSRSAHSHPRFASMHAERRAADVVGEVRQASAVRDEPGLYAWFLHQQLLDALFASGSRTRSLRMVWERRVRGHQDAYTERLERWLRTHEVRPLEMAVIEGTCRIGLIVWTELDFHWSDAAGERIACRDGRTDARSDSHATAAITDDEHRYVQPGPSHMQHLQQ